MIYLSRYEFWGLVRLNNHILLYKMYLPPETYLPVGTLRNELFYATGPWKSYSHENSLRDSIFREDQLVPAGMDDAVVAAVTAGAVGAVGGGTDTMERILALQTPLQQITVGSGRRLSTQTWGEMTKNNIYRDGQKSGP